MLARLIYLHGFRSSPASFKASWLAQRMAALGRASQYVCPQLPASPRAAMGLLEGLAPAAGDTLIGSSLGGYYATWLAEQAGCRCVLLNPAIRPADSLAHHIGVSTQYHSDEPFEFKTEYLNELRSIDVPMISLASRYFLIAATGDELLDWRDMVGHYPGARHKVIQGSDHGLSDFAAYGDEVLAFAGVPGVAGAGGHNANTGSGSGGASS